MSFLMLAAVGRFANKAFSLKPLMLTAIATFCLISQSSSAFAGADNVSPTQTSPAEYDSWEFSVTPRVFLGSFADKRFATTDVEQTKSLVLPMYGASLNIKPGGSDLNIDFTYLAGRSNKSAFNEIDLPSGDYFVGTISADRSDFEAYVHVPLGDHDTPVKVTFNVGARYISSKSKAVGLDDLGTGFQFTENSKYYLFETGVSVFANIGEDNKNTVFATFNIMSGYKGTNDTNICCGEPIENIHYGDGSVGGIDGYFGFRHELGSLPAWLSVRGRFQVISQGKFDFAQPTLMYGPEINLTIAF